LVSLRRGGMSGGGAGAGVLGNVIRTLHYNTFNPAEHNVLVLSDAEGGTYELMYVRALGCVLRVVVTWLCVCGG
jgi:hypothetical protein